MTGVVAQPVAAERLCRQRRRIDQPGPARERPRAGAEADRSGSRGASDRRGRAPRLEGLVDGPGRRRGRGGVDAEERQLIAHARWCPSNPGGVPLATMRAEQRHYADVRVRAAAARGRRRVPGRRRRLELGALGWDADWAVVFAPHVDDGPVAGPGRHRVQPSVPPLHRRRRAAGAACRAGAPCRRGPARRSPPSATGSPSGSGRRNARPRSKRSCHAAPTSRARPPASSPSSRSWPRTSTSCSW